MDSGGTRVTLRMRRVRRTLLLPRVAPCPGCRRDVPVVTVLEARSLLETGSEELARLIADGTVHAIPTATGFTWICRNSIFPAPTRSLP